MHSFAGRTEAVVEVGKTTDLELLRR